MNILGFRVSPQDESVKITLVLDKDEFTKMMAHFGYSSEIVRFDGGPETGYSYAINSSPLGESVCHTDIDYNKYYAKR